MPTRAVRAGVAGGAALAGALTVVTLVRYPAAMNPLPVAAVYLAVLVAGLAAVGYLVWRAGRSPGPRAGAVLRTGAGFGLLAGACWVAEMTLANLGYGLGRWTVLPYYATIAGAAGLSVAAGTVGAWRHRRLATGVLVGLWSGLTSGLIGLVTMELLVLTAMSTLVHDPQNIQEQRGSADLPAAIAGDFLAAGINHLVLVGLVVGTVLATAGAAAGMALRGARRPADRAPG
jgi:hypothetical protein